MEYIYICVCAHTMWPSLFYLQITFVKRLSFCHSFPNEIPWWVLKLTKQTLWNLLRCWKQSSPITPSKPEACVVSCGTRRLRLELIRKGVAPHAAALITVRDEMEATEKKPIRPCWLRPAVTQQPGCDVRLDSLNYSHRRRRRRSLAAPRQPWQIPLIPRRPCEHHHLRAMFELQTRTTWWLTEMPGVVWLRARRLIKRVKKIPLAVQLHTSPLWSISNSKKKKKKIPRGMQPTHGIWGPGRAVVSAVRSTVSTGREGKTHKCRV